MTKLIFHLVGCFILATARAREKPTFPNIGYLGRGYDIFHGNPSSTIAGTDPGFRMQIFRFNYGTALTPDQRYRIPDGLEVRAAEACTISFGSTVVETSSEYQKTLNRHVQAGASGTVMGIKAKFSASKTYKEVRKNTSARKNVFILTEGICSKYQAEILQFLPPQVSANFKAAVERVLPETYNKGKLQRFFKAFGTHIAKSLVMGARYGEVSEVDTDEWTKYKSTTTTWKSDASASIKASFSAGTMTSVEKSRAETFKKIVKSQKTYSVGSRPPADGKALTWAQMVFNNPMPISYQVDRIYSILTPDYFPDMNRPKLERKKAQVEKYFKEMCSELVKAGEIDTCDPKDPPKAPPKTCRLCTSCARRGDYSIETGRKRNRGDWGPWDMFGDQCSGHMTKNWGEWKLCCSPPEPQCRLCHSCGGDYPFYAGHKLNQGDWGPYRTFQGRCGGAYNDFWGQWIMCCRGPKTACRMCASCGAGMYEVGQRKREGDWGPFKVLSESQCRPGSTARGLTFKKEWDNVKICCPK